VDIYDRARQPERFGPPRSLVHAIGGGDYLAIGQEFFGHFTELADLQPDQRVLDIGCGVGRMAYPLSTYLTDQGGYWGLDIVRPAIKWCQRNIARDRKNFHFEHMDVHSRKYHPAGQVAAADYVFPFEDDQFDFICLTSVFTHMLPPDMAHYLKEIRRVLRPGGRCLMTCFLINEESAGLIERGRSQLSFRHPLAGCFTTNIKVPERAIAYREADLLTMLEAAGLSLHGDVHYGAWCGRSTHLSMQDIVVVTF